MLDALRLYLGSRQGPLPPLEGLLGPAQREGVAGLLGHLAAEHPELPGAGPLVQEHIFEFARNAHFAARLAEIGRALGARGVQALVLKGAALIPTAYGGVLGLRPLGDLDLLVRPEQRPAAEAALAALPPVEGLPVPVDLHQDLVNSERIGARARAFRFDAEGLWARSRPLPGAPPALRCLSPEDEALNLAVHALKHSYSRLIWLVDLALALPAADPAALSARAERTGAARALAYAARLVEALFEVETDRRLSATRLGRLELRYLAGVATRRHSHLLGSVVMAFSLPWPARPAYLWEAFFPAPSVLRGLFPGTPGWLLYPRRAVQLVELFLSDRRRASRT